MEGENEPIAGTDGRKAKGRATISFSFLLHASLFTYWVFVHVHEWSLFEAARSLITDEHRIPGASEFPYRGKYLTIINLWLQTMFFCFSIFGHLIPNGRIQKIFKWLLDMSFTTIVFPTTFLIFSVFWPIYFIDADSIYPKVLQKLLPAYLNHIYHTGIVVTVLLELFMVCHRYPGALLGVFIMGSFNLAYLCVMTYCLLTFGTWPYRFMNKLSQPGLMMFFGISFLLYIAMYYIGKMLSHLRWGERLRHVKED